MDDALSRSYDEMPYESNPFHFTHPDALASAAYLAGMTPAPVESCRVLEIGCATGGNLAPMAHALPRSRFVGIDLSPRQIEIGREHAAGLELANLELRAMDLMDIDQGFGEFDYIISQGVYSWCPPPVQEKILQISVENLAENGVAYISYNTYPGWHRWMALREIMLHQVGHLSSPRERVTAARQTLEALTANLPPDSGSYAAQIRESVEHLRTLSDTHLFHEYLEPFNEPLQFHEMLARVARHGLAWLAESTQQTVTADLTPAARQALSARAKDPLDLEQQLDFLRNRSFRKSLFVHAEATFDRAAASEPSLAKLRSLHINATCTPEPAAAGGLETFRADRVKISTANPLVRTILRGLCEIAPREVTLVELTRAVRGRLGEAVRDEEVADAVAACHGLNLVGLHLWTPRCASEAGARPMTSAVVRLHALGTAPLPNLRHRGIGDLHAIDRALLSLCDGTRDREALLAGVLAAAARGEFTLERGGEPVRDPAELRALLIDAIEPSLQRLARDAFFER